MNITAAEFIASPALYLEKIDTGPVAIEKGGTTIAILAKPSTTPIADSLLGILSGSGIKKADDIKALRTGV